MLQNTALTKTVLGQDFRPVFLTLANIPKRDNSAQRQAVIAAENRCLLCGRQPPVVRSLSGAHIQPYEEYGSNETDNLISLCNGVGTLRGGAGVPQLGCHQLFDYYQVWTRHEMEALRKSIGTANYIETSKAMVRKKETWIERMTDRLQLALANRRWDEVRELARDRLLNASPSEKLTTESAGSDFYFSTIFTECPSGSIIKERRSIQTVRVELIRSCSEHCSHVQPFRPCNFFSPEDHVATKLCLINLSTFVRDGVFRP